VTDDYEDDHELTSDFRNQQACKVPVVWKLKGPECGRRTSCTPGTACNKFSL